MLRAGTIRRVRQTLLATTPTGRARGLAGASRETGIGSRLHVQLTRQRHVVIRTTDTVTAGSNTGFGQR